MLIRKCKMFFFVQEFRKNGFNDEDSAQLGQIASLYQNVADEAVSAGDAASFMISQMIAFDIPAENALHIVDAVNEVRFGASINRVNCWKPKPFGKAISSQDYIEICNKVQRLSKAVRYAIFDKCNYIYIE